MNNKFKIENYLTSEELIDLINNNLNLDYDMSEQQKNSFKRSLIEKINREVTNFKKTLEKNPNKYNYDPEIVFCYKNNLVTELCRITKTCKNYLEYSDYYEIYLNRPFIPIDRVNEFEYLILLLKKDKSEIIVRKYEYGEGLSRTLIKHEVYNNSNPFESTINIKSGFNIVNTLKLEILEDVWESEAEYDYYSVCNNLGRSRLLKRYSEKNILYTQTSNTGYKVYHSEKLKQIILSWDIETLTDCYHENDTTKSIDKFNNYLESNDFKIVGKISCSIWRLMFCDNELLEKYKADYNTSHVKVDINNCKVKMTAYAHTNARKEEHNFLPDKTINYNEYIVLDYGNL